MTPTRRQVRQLIREELSRALREGRYDDEPEEEGTGYEYLSVMPSTVQWVDGPVDHRWLNRYLNHYKGVPYSMRSMLASDFEKMLSGKPVDPDIVERYINADGTSNVSRQTVEALVYALLSPDVVV